MISILDCACDYQMILVSDAMMLELNLNGAMYCIGVAICDKYMQITQLT